MDSRIKNPSFVFLIKLLPTQTNIIELKIANLDLTQKENYKTMEFLKPRT